MTANLKFLAVPAVMALLAGCGGSAAGGSGSSSGGGTPLTVTAADFMLTPATLNAKPGEKVTVTMTNNGGTEHNFSITELNVSLDVEKGKTESVTFTATGSNNLQFFCKYHKTKMTGILNLGGTNTPAGGPTPSMEQKTY